MPEIPQETLEPTPKRAQSEPEGFGLSGISSETRGGEGGI